MQNIQNESTREQDILTDLEKLKVEIKFEEDRTDMLRVLEIEALLEISRHLENIETVMWR